MATGLSIWYKKYAITFNSGISGKTKVTCIAAGNVDSPAVNSYTAPLSIFHCSCHAHASVSVVDNPGRQVVVNSGLTDLN